MWVRLVVIALALCGIVLAAEAARTEQNDSDVNQFAATLLDFHERIDDYMDVREELADEVPDADVTRYPADIRARENVLSARIRAHRAGAKHGDIFTPAIRAAFRRLLRPELKGQEGRELRSELKEDAPAPGAVPLQVNGKYPAGVPFATTPPNILAVLPPLPPELEYRVVGRDLVLLDQPADVILDYIRNAVPAAKPGRE